MNRMIMSGLALLALTGTAAQAQQSDAAKADARQQLRSALTEDPVIPSTAPAGYDATVVVFSDYQCPYCHAMHTTLSQVQAGDRKVRIVYRDWPIFGEVSLEAARTAMAARYQGKHAALNDALLRTPGKLSSAIIRQAAQRAGVDWPRLQADLTRHRPEIDAAIARTDRYARALRLSGTPALVIGDFLVPGAIDTATVQGLLEKARAK